MTKTIEELANEYYLNEVINGDTCDDKDGWTDCFVSGADALMQLPLASRLTAEEKEKIQEQYDEVRIFTENIDPCEETSEYYLGQKVVLERIFGKELFEQ